MKQEPTKYVICVEDNFGGMARFETESIDHLRANFKRFERAKIFYFAKRTNRPKPWLIPDVVWTWISYFAFFYAEKWPVRSVVFLLKIFGVKEIVPDIFAVPVYSAALKEQVCQPDVAFKRFLTVCYQTK